MPPAPPLRILFAGDPAPADAHAALEAAGFAVSPTGLSGIDPAEVARSQAVLIGGRRPGAVHGPGPLPAVADRAGRAVRADRLAGRPTTCRPPAGLDAGADAVLAPGGRRRTTWSPS